MKLYFYQIILVTLVTIASITPVTAQETIHITTDRSLYISGEPMWIYAHCSASSGNKHSNISKVGYIELLNKENTPVFQSKIHLTPGNNTVRVYVPDTISTGNYILRAYTQWMRNYHYDLFKYKPISVINPFSADKFPTSESLFKKDTVLTFAESDKLLADKENLLMVQVLDPYGKGRQVKAFITNSNHDTISNFNTNKQGFAKTTLRPSLGDSYYIKYSVDGSSNVHKLTSASKEGFVLSLKFTNNNTHLTVITNQKNTTGYKLHLSSLKGDFIQNYIIKDNFIEISNDKLPQGYICAQLLNHKGELLASRYFLAHVPNAITPSQIKLDKSIYKPREQVNMQLTGFTHLKNKTVSVCKACLTQSTDYINNQNTLGSYSYNNLKKWVTENIEINDILLCFSAPNGIWQTIPKINYIPEYKGKIITGTLLNKTNHQPIAHEKVMLNIVGSKSIIDIASTDSLGRFKFTINQFGNFELVIQPFQSKEGLLNYKVDIDYAYCNIFPHHPIPEFNLTKNEAYNVNKAIINMQINTVYNQNRYDTKKEINSDTISFYGSPNYSIQLSKFIELTTAAEIIKELVPHTVISKKKGKPYITIYEESSMNTSVGESFTLVDGIYINDVDRILEIEGNEIKKIDLINSNYFVKGIELGRILAFYTQNGNLEAVDFDKRIFRQSHTGYSTPYIFHATDYDSTSISKSSEPDYRNLLYWKTDFTNNKHSFFTSDEKSKFTITINGINQFGELEQYQKEFEVK